MRCAANGIQSPSLFSSSSRKSNTPEQLGLDAALTLEQFTSQLHDAPQWHTVLSSQARFVPVLWEERTNAFHLTLKRQALKALLDESKSVRECETVLYFPTIAHDCPRSLKDSKVR